jgi:hypothetical protein
MSDCKAQRNEKGVVLVVALLILAVLSLMVFALAYNMASYLKMTATVREKSQTYYTSVNGIEQLRAWIGSKQTVGGIANQYCYSNLFSNTWCNLLPTSITESYQDVTSIIAGSATPSYGGVTYKIYFKNNEEGNPTLDNDQIVMASVVATAPDNSTKTVVEAMMINTYSGNYAQSGGSVSKGGSVNQAGASSTGTFHN